MPTPAEILLERVDLRLAEMGKTRYWLSMQVTDGQRSGVLTDLARKGHLPGEPRIHRMAEELSVSVDWLMGRSDRREGVLSEVSVGDRHLEWRGAARMENPGIPLVGTGDCADLELTADDGGMVRVDRASFDPEYHVRYLTRPPALVGQAGLYAIYYHGESMLPRFEPGEVGIVDPHRPPMIGDYVVVQLRGEDHDDVESVLVKRLTGRNAREVRLEQFNPPLTFTLPARLVKRLHRILPQTELLF